MMNITDNITQIVGNYTEPTMPSPPLSFPPGIAGILGRIGSWLTTAFKTASAWSQGHVPYEIVFLIALVFTVIAVIWLIKKLSK
jgi:hypothetical protein